MAERKRNGKNQEKEKAQTCLRRKYDPTRRRCIARIAAFIKVFEQQAPVISFGRGLKKKEKTMSDPTGASIARQTEVRTAISEQEQMVSLLEEKTGRLHEKLVPIMSAKAVKPLAETKKEPKYNCEIAIQINTTTERVKSLSAGINTILEDIEI